MNWKIWKFEKEAKEKKFRQGRLVHGNIYATMKRLRCCQLACSQLVLVKTVDCWSAMREYNEKKRKYCADHPISWFTAWERLPTTL